MAKCNYCGSETELFDCGAPVCVECSNESAARRQQRANLFHKLEEATKRAESASDAFTAITSDIPSGIPHPDGIQRIKNASRELTAARDEMMKAHNRLNDFLSGVVPED